MAFFLSLPRPRNPIRATSNTFINRVPLCDAAEGHFTVQFTRITHRFRRRRVPCATTAAGASEYQAVTSGQSLP